MSEVLAVIGFVGAYLIVGFFYGVWRVWTYRDPEANELAIAMLGWPYMVVRWWSWLHGVSPVALWVLTLRRKVKNG